jgi:hypothetical protein
MAISSIISILSLLVALTAIFLGPYFAHRTTVAQMRQVWINSLRDCVAELLSLSCSAHVAGAMREPEEEAPPDSYANMMLLENKIELLLTPRVEAHQLLIRKVHELVVVLHKTKRALPDKHYFDQKADLELSITEETQNIIRYEWTRTKKLF